MEPEEDKRIPRSKSKVKLPPVKQNSRPKSVASTISTESKKFSPKISQNRSMLDLVEKKPRTPFHEAVATGSKEKMHKILEDGGNIEEKDSKGRTAVHIAVKHGKISNLN
jgi:ankyrin repeat protein